MIIIENCDFFKAFGVFGLCQILAFIDYLKSKLSQEQFDVLFHAIFSLFGIIIVTAVTVLMITGV